MVSKYKCWLLVIGLILMLWPAYEAHATGAAPHPPSAIQQKIMRFVGSQDSVMVADPNGNVVVSINADKALVPASILKVLTSLAALEHLGRDFRFITEFYTDDNKNLKIKGYGDPLLISEQLKKISTRLSLLVDKVGDIILDDTFFNYPIRIPGRGNSTEPYDAPNGALCVNFNTVAFARQGGRWVSDEPQTPLLPTVISKIEASGLKSGRITLVGGRRDALEYTGALFEHFLNNKGISVTGIIRPGRVNPLVDQLVWTYASDADLSEAVSKLLEFSNNFIANQILLVLGAQTSGAPASVEKGLAVLKGYYQNTLGITSGALAEASGISRQNRVTARAMLTIVNRFSPYYGLMRKKNRQYYKTGHLRGIRTRAGYITSATEKGLYRFVVILNTPGKTTHRIMEELEKALP